MSDQILHTIALAGVFLALFASAELLYHHFHFRAEVTRKYVHIVTGTLTMLFPILIGDPWLVFYLCSSFFGILLLSLYAQLLPSINAVDRKTWGSIAYPIVVSACYFVYSEMEMLVGFYIPVLIMAICDPIASLVGKNWPRGEYLIFSQSKTLSGSASFFIVAAVVSFLNLSFLTELSILHLSMLSFVLALATTISEAIAFHGLDNLTIPTAALAVLLGFNKYVIAL